MKYVVFMEPPVRAIPGQMGYQQTCVWQMGSWWGVRVGGQGRSSEKWAKASHSAMPHYIVLYQIPFNFHVSRCPIGVFAECQRR
jgi:hypothetical protein